MWVHALITSWEVCRPYGKEIKVFSIEAKPLIPYRGFIHSSSTPWYAQRLISWPGSGDKSEKLEKTLKSEWWSQTTTLWEKRYLVKNQVYKCRVKIECTNIKVYQNISESSISYEWCRRRQSKAQSNIRGRQTDERACESLKSSHKSAIWNLLLLKFYFWKCGDALSLFIINRSVVS